MQIYNSPASVTQGTTPAGNTVSGYGGASGRGWDVVHLGAAATLAYDSTYSIQPDGFDIKVAVGSPAAASFVQWGGSAQTPPILTSWWFRQVLYFTSIPGATLTVMGGCQATAEARALDVIITSAGKIEVRDNGGSVRLTSASTIPLNTRFRVEGYVTPITPAGTTATFSFSLYATEFTTTALETQTTAANALNMGDALGYWRWGQAFSGNASTGPWWFGDVALSNTGYVGPGAILQQMTAGAPDEDSFTVISKVIGGTSVRLKVATDPALTQNVFYVAAQIPDTYGYVNHSVTGLASFTRYYCRLADTPAGQPETLFGAAGSCKTLPAAGVPASFTVSYASCIATNDLNSPPSTTAMADWVDRQADLNIFLGDYDYFDATYTDTYSQIGVFESQTFSEADQGAGVMQQMISTAWGFYVASDHDTGPDNGDSDVPWMPYNIAARQEIFPMGVLGDQSVPPAGLYQAWVCGRVRFIMIDIRNLDRTPGADPDGPSKTMLGATQLAWFYGQLTMPEPLKIVIEDTQWMGDVVAGQNDKWWAYDYERQQIISFVQANQATVQNMMWWHGDFHGLGCQTGPGNPWGGFSVLCAAPVCETGIAVQNTSTFAQWYNNGGGECRLYGRVAITDDGTQITVAYQGWDAANQVAQIAQTDVYSAPSATITPGGAVTISPAGPAAAAASVSAAGPAAAAVTISVP